MGYELICLVVILVAYLIYPHEYIEGIPPMGSPADLQKLIENMKRANSITDRAGQDAAKHTAIMDNFEKRLDINHENMAKIEEYEKLMASMDQMGSNGGPALEATFPSTSTVQPVGLLDLGSPVAASSSKGSGRFDQ